MQFEAETVSEAVRRLRRVEGQVAGIIRMVEAQRECRDIVTQISAASKALDQVGFKLVASCLRASLADDGDGADAVTMQADLERLFLKLA